MTFVIVLILLCVWFMCFYASGKLLIKVDKMNGYDPSYLFATLISLLGPISLIASLFVYIGDKDFKIKIPFLKEFWGD